MQTMAVQQINRPQPEAAGRRWECLKLRLGPCTTMVPASWTNETHTLLQAARNQPRLVHLGKSQEVPRSPIADPTGPHAMPKKSRLSPADVSIWIQRIHKIALIRLSRAIQALLSDY